MYCYEYAFESMHGTDDKALNNSSLRELSWLYIEGLRRVYDHNVAFGMFSRGCKLSNIKWSDGVEGLLIAVFAIFTLSGTATASKPAARPSNK